MLCVYLPILYKYVGIFYSHHIKNYMPVGTILYNQGCIFELDWQMVTIGTHIKSQNSVDTIQLKDIGGMLIV